MGPRQGGCWEEVQATMDRREKGWWTGADEERGGEATRGVCEWKGCGEKVF